MSNRRFNAKSHEARPDVSEENPLPTEHQPDPQPTSNLIEEIKETADKLARDHATRGDVKIIARALKELRYAFKVFTPYRRKRKITVFGSARTKPDHPAYQEAVEFGRRMAEVGWYVVTGAGGGIMEGAHVGAGRAMSMGLNIMLPFEQSSNPIITDDPKLVHFKYFFTRKLMFVKEVHAIALFAGGFGTQDEAWETMTLIQTGKRDLMPIVCIDYPGSSYWADWLSFIKKQLLDQKWISPADLSLFKVVNSTEEAVDEVLGFYSVYNSMRFIREKLYLRLHRAPDDALLDRLNTEFADIVASGQIERVTAHAYESDDDHLAELPRLAFIFNRRDYGRLRQMVDVINAELAVENVAPNP
ncbi:putative lysine decarboxylase [Caulifigura coniformis]|uniref:AMP nucleosidase n=1 Tax=Caulifigura coniformis TaxID=2527983 RepID=A0A517SK45_9PLAN|nr:LOG family protein [Caulifigura coniformis]QDT56495.1 putative lysine decarboxylase [Caulifigura coniformis]